MISSLNSKEIQNLLDSAVTKFGSYAQLRLLQEECAELIVAINHYYRNTDNRASSLDEVIDEIADVFIMLEQVVQLFDTKAISKQIDKKLFRLSQKLNI
jgi:NTP pyrophosphatase (non-canonical NTP hydrolase)